MHGPARRARSSGHGSPRLGGVGPGAGRTGGAVWRVLRRPLDRGDVVRLGAPLTVAVLALALAVPLTGADAATAPRPQAPTAAGAAAATSSGGTALSWVVTSAAGQRLADQPSVSFGKDRPGAAEQVLVDDGDVRQVVRGVGGSLTESSAHLLAQLPAAAREAALADLVSPTQGAGAAVLRQPLGASDFALADRTFDDLAPGRTDPALAGFSTAADGAEILPLLARAARLNPGLAVVVSAWSPPAWMKTTGNTHGGQLDVSAEDAYARYLTRAVADYRAAGVPVVALTPVNEPLHATADYPSTQMTAPQEARLVGEHLRPALDAAGLADVGVLGYDHNWDDTAYPTSLVTGPYADAFAGTAFHCYAGDVSAQAQVLAAAPDKQVWTTECSGGSWATDFGANLGWGAKNMLVGAFRNGSTASLWWNLALDPTGGPTNGGCTTCRGVLTVDPATGEVTRNVEWYLLAHVGRYVVPGGHVVGSTAATPDGVVSVAFRNPDGSHVLVLSNDTASPRTVTVRWAGHAASLTLPARSLATARW